MTERQGGEHHIAATGVRLLDQILTNTILSDYASIPPQDPASISVEPVGTGDDAGVSRRLQHLASLPVVAVVSAILVFAAISQATSTTGRSRTQSALAQRVTAARAAAEALQESNGLMSQENARLASLLASQTKAGAAVNAAIEEVSAGAGALTSTGPGECVTLDSIAPPSDAVLQAVVNLVNQSAPDAVAINGIRVSTRTAIRSGGSQLLVGYQPVLMPLHVCATYPSTAARSRLATVWSKIERLASAQGISTRHTIGSVTIRAAAERMLTVHAAVAQ